MMLFFYIEYLSKIRTGATERTEATERIPGATESKVEATERIAEATDTPPLSFSH